MKTAAMQSTVLTEKLNGPMAWSATTPIEQEVVVTLGDECLAELDTVARFLADNPLPTLLVDADAFIVDHCRRLCHDVRRRLDHGPGFVLIEALPVDSYELDIVEKLYWLLMSLVGRPVAQKWNGEMIYDVTDTGKKATAGSGVRSSKTNGGQIYHTDNSFNLPPDFVGLFCVRPAMEGGVSGLISFDSVYNQLLGQHADVLPRLYQPFFFDRQREHAPGDRLYSSSPVFERSNQVLHTRLATSLIRQGYIVADQEIDGETERALGALDEVMESPGLGKTFDFTPGQIQIVNNRRLGHRRTAFTDSPDPAQKRHLLRIWLRDEGRRSYMG